MLRRVLGRLGKEPAADLDSANIFALDYVGALSMHTRGDLWLRNGSFPYFSRCEFVIYWPQDVLASELTYRTKPMMTPGSLRPQHEKPSAIRWQDVLEVRVSNDLRLEIELLLRNGSRRMLLRAVTSCEYDKWLRILRAWKAAIPPNLLAGSIRSPWSYQYNTLALNNELCAYI